MDRDEMSTLYRGPPIDASYQVSVHLAKRFQRRRFLKISNICTYYTLRFYFPYLSLLVQPVTIFVYGPVTILVYGPARYLHYYFR
jgi:hypothetical protein